MEQGPRVRASMEQVAASGHPVRRRLLEVLGVDGPATASQLAERTGQLVGNVSHHLKMLARAGLVEEVPELAKDRRERWWRHVPLSLSWSLADVRGDPVGEAVAVAAEYEHLEHHLGRVRGWLAARDAGRVRRGVDPGRVRDGLVDLGDARGARPSSSASSKASKEQRLTSSAKATGRL